MITANDERFSGEMATGDYSLQIVDNASVDGVPNIHAGRYGLGRQFALPFDEDGRQLGVRPYRKVISAQAVFRREAFGPN